jgi:hypothetical protein
MAYWPMQEEALPGTFLAHDVAGSFDAEANDVFPSADGPFAGARSFEFKGFSWLGVPNNGSAFARDEFSISTWVRMDNTSSRSDGLPPGSVLFRLRGAGYTLYVNDSNGAPSLYPSGCPAALIADNINLVSPPGRWHHLVATRDESASRIYLDGELVAETLDFCPIYAFGDKVGIGRDADHPSDYLNGALSHFAFFDRALSSQEVAMIASARP